MAHTAIRCSTCGCSGTRRFAVASGGITLVFFAMFGMFFLLTQYLQFVLDYSPLEAAVRLLPFSVVMMIVAPQTPQARRSLRGRRGGVDRPRVHRRRASCSASHVRRPTRRTGTSSIVDRASLAGGMALTMSPMTTQLMSAVPRDRAGIGSAMNDTTRELGGALGVAVLGSLVTSQYTSGLADAVARPARRRSGRSPRPASAACAA